ncbi:shikimate dehydrogenase family protein [Psychroflexus sp. MES1-P1E]|uniref:shikimate dehydrogenase family protein n=1 Tax=Psychroflexus sp. MES1-P1E TaxID=2058320 RepID=UPI000C7B84C1|nr:shikimate dehydrogenase [Psychroflexus sp. MES1-P1E]PKG41158.1 shikimate dehydrogenase [Psychroflexus sp. MES1-P1E]
MTTYGLLGRNIDYSFSKTFFNTKFHNEAIRAKYINFDIEHIEEVKQIASNSLNLGGLNVTIPYKEEVIPFLDGIDPQAEQIGAVNTIKIENKRLIGYNTDVFGFTKSIFNLIAPNHEAALILGTGGASKAIRHALVSMGYHINMVSREKDKGDFTYKDLTSEIIKSHQLIVNCTPLGTHPDVNQFPPIPYEFIDESHLLYDLVYNPSLTRFLAQGKDKGAQIINGEQMLISQAEKAWEIWNQ